jgi:hypothetical protein
MLGLFLVIVYAVSAWFVLKQLPSRRAKTIAWAIVVLTWGPALIVAFAPPFFFQPEAVAAFVGKSINVLLLVLFPLAPLAALGLGMARWATTPRSKRIVAGTTVVLGYFGLFADEIAGRIYLSHLCTTEAGVKVYQTVELPREYWDEKGKPKYLGANGFVDMKLLPNRFEWRNVDKPYIDSVIKIEKWRWKLVDKETKNVLGEKITFVRHYGWLNQFSPASTVGESCRDLGGESNREELARKEREQEQKFFHEILKPAASAR